MMMMKGMTSMPGMMMAMYFVTGKDLANFLFKGWNTNGQLSGLLGMCAAVLFATILLEALRTLMAFLSLRNSRLVTKLQSQDQMNTCGKTKYALADDDVDDPKTKQRLATHAVLSVLQFLSTGLAYLLMLAVMTYNVWIGVSVLIGTLVGYFFFGALRDHMTYSQTTSWPAVNSHTEKRNEILSRSNGAYSSGEVHM